MRFVIYPYKLASKSATRLTQALGGHKVRPNGRYRYREGDVVINWGSARVPDWMNDEARAGIVNQPEAINVASNKLLCLRHLERDGIPTVEFTTDREEARGWRGVYARMLLRSHSGNGIVYVNEGEDVPDAPLYTHAIRNTGEYRVHVMNGRVISYRKKSRREGEDPTPDERQVQTLANGWIYRTGNLRRVPRIEELAINTIESLGLDFGAVDIIKDGNNDIFVLEVNTAVGLADNTLEEYVEALEADYRE